MKNNILTIGTFDLFHKGHKRLLKRIAKNGNLFVFINSDKDLKSGYKTNFIDNESKRLENVKTYKYVKDAFIVSRNDQKRFELAKELNINEIIMGNDYSLKVLPTNNKPYILSKLLNIEYKTYKRTPFISSTKMKRKLDKRIK